MNNTNASVTPAPEPVHDIAGWRRLALWPLGLLARTWGWTLRFETTDEDLRNFLKTDEPLAMVLWHNRLFLAPQIVRRYRRRPVYALVSASPDGAWLAAFFATIGMRSVRGSSSQLAREAVGALIARLREGNDIGITPDGPRGPMYDFKGGAYIVTRRAGTPVLLIGGRFTSAWRLKSWDGFYLPKPFSRVQMLCRLVPAAELRAQEMSIERLRDRLMAINPD